MIPYALIAAKIGADIEIRFRSGATRPGVIASINVDDGTIDARSKGGVYYPELPRYEWSNRDEAGPWWQWPGAPEPTDPADFKPRVFRDAKGKIRRVDDDPEPPNAA